MKIIWVLKFGKVTGGNVGLMGGRGDDRAGFEVIRELVSRVRG